MASSLRSPPHRPKPGPIFRFFFLCVFASLPFAMDTFEERREAGTRRRVLLTPMSVLPPSTKRRRRQTQTCACDLKMDDERGPTINTSSSAVPGGSGRRTRDRSGAATVVRGALVVLVAGGLGTGVTAFSAVVSAPPRQRPHHQLISTNAHQQPAPMMVPSPPLLGASTPQTRQFLEDIISGQAAAAAAAEQQEQQQQQQQERSFGSNSTILGLTDWGGAGGAFRLKEEPTASAAVAVDRDRPAPFPRERASSPGRRAERAGRGQGEDDTGPPRVLRRAAKAAVPAKKAEPKYGYRRSGNK